MKPLSFALGTLFVFRLQFVVANLTAPAVGVAIMFAWLVGALVVHQWRTTRAPRSVEPIRMPLPTARVV